MTTVTIYHNPRCSKSRQTLALLQDRNLEIEIIEYLKSPPDAATLRTLIQRLGLAPAELLRGKEHRDLGLGETDDAEELIERIVAHPEIIQRPIVVHGAAARIGRPPENVLEIL